MAEFRAFWDRICSRNPKLAESSHVTLTVSELRRIAKLAHDDGAKARSNSAMDAFFDIFRDKGNGR